MDISPSVQCQLSSWLHALVQEHGSALCLYFIGVQPGRRGEGLGSRMLQHVAQVRGSMGAPPTMPAAAASSAALLAW